MAPAGPRATGTVLAGATPTGTAPAGAPPQSGTVPAGLAPIGTAPAGAAPTGMAPAGVTLLGTARVTSTKPLTSFSSSRKPALVTRAGSGQHSWYGSAADASGSGEPAAPRRQSLLRSQARCALLSAATPRVR